MADCHPDHWVFSESGEVPFEVPGAQLFVAGGHLELCLNHALHQVLYKWVKQPRQNFTVTYFMDAIYSNGKNVDAGFRSPSKVLQRGEGARPPVLKFRFYDSAITLKM